MKAKLALISLICGRVFRVKCGNETCFGNARLPYESELIAMIPNVVLETPMYALLTQLLVLDTSNYRVVSAEIGTDIVVSTKIYAYRIYTVRFVVAIKGANSDQDLLWEFYRTHYSFA